MALQRKKKSGRGDTIRRMLSSGLAGFSQAFGDAYKQKTLIDRAEQGQRATSDRAMLTDILNRDQELQTKVASGEITPEQAETMAADSRKYAKVPYPLPNFKAVAAPSERRAEPIRRRIEGAQSPEMMPTEEGVRADFRGIGDTGGEIPPIPGPGANLANYSPAVASAMETRRQRLTGFDEARERKLADAARTARTTARETGLGTEEATAETFPAKFARDFKVATQGQDVQTAGELAREKTVGPVRAQNQARAAGMSEEARMRVQFNPKWMAARLKEATDKAAAEALAAGNKEQQKLVRETANAAGAVLPLVEKLRAISDRVNTRSGTSARVAGAIRTARAAAGSDADVRELQQTRAQLIRPLAVAMGVREANISNFDQILVEKGIMISQFSTKEEAAQSLNNIRDLIAIAPLVATSPAMDAQGKADYAAGLLRARRDAQNAAIQAGATSFIDPATNAIIPVIR